MKQKRIAIIGHFGGKENYLDGQTVKTKSLYEELSNYTDWKIKIADTYYRHKNPIRLLWQTASCLLTTKDIIILVSGNGMRTYFPILYIMAKVFGKRIYHSVIGAHLDRYVIKYPAFKKYLNAFVVNWVETASMCDRMEAVGVTNGQTLQNFKRLRILKELPSEMQKKPYKLCTFSRVMEEKGIADAVEAVKAANEALGETAYTLDIYGPIDREQEAWFAQLKEKFPDFVVYQGSVPYGESVGVLKNYFCLLFPTRYFTEGVPGTIIDGYAAGIPVIASKWESIADVLDEGITGYGYEFEKVEDLTALLVKFAGDPEMITGLKPNCIQKAKTYMPESVLPIMVEKIEKPR